MSGRQAALWGFVAIFVAGLAAVAIGEHRGNEVDGDTRERIEQAWTEVQDTCIKPSPRPTDASIRSADAALGTIIGLYRRDPEARGEFGFVAENVSVRHVLERIARSGLPEHPDCGRLRRAAAEALSG